MKIELSPIQARIIGCLLEKETTTPDYYPLTLNSLTSACNQKSNRDPVMSLSEAQVMDAAQSLIDQHLISDESSFNSRVNKFKHRFCNTEFGSLQLTPQQRGIVCSLLLRGPQTPGELRTRTNRLCEFQDVKQVETILDEMAHQTPPLVVKLAKQPGKREARYQHLFSGEVDEAMLASDTSAEQSSSASHLGLEARIEQLEAQVAALTQLIEEKLG
ncbi:MAG: YceH family protein [Vibrio sp.]